MLLPQDAIEHVFPPIQLTIIPEICKPCLFVKLIVPYRQIFLLLNNNKKQDANQIGLCILFLVAILKILIKRGTRISINTRVDKF